jgi:predicted transcriptional regulator
MTPFRYPRNPNTQTNWRRKKALEVAKLLPATRLELQQKLGLAKDTIDAAIAELRKTTTVYTVQAGRQISYEIKEKE